MLESLKKEVYEANMLLPKHNLITFTWGNVSGIDRKSNLIVIKPSGVAYEELKIEDMVVVDLNGEVVEGNLRPSSDTLTHIQLYKAWPEIGAVVHTHSPKATAWAQAGWEIPCFGTTHADYIRGSVPCARSLTPAELEEGYEMNTGKVIVQTFASLDYMATPCVLCRNHGPFTWGNTAKKAVHNAVILEEVARMALDTILINPDVQEAPMILQDKHYFRKHGKNAYYGQK